MALILPFFNCFGLSSNSSSQVSDYAQNSSQMKSSTSEKPKSKEKSMGAPIVVPYFPVNNNYSSLL
ncbi:hypothetical protein MtrunA17_Chr3g0087441 [Medicago truncatula]|uniref:Uncharacterized protein n=1 Tax=Medicago truncatula TaxID=3880 RepID=A0A396ILH8_MEDTR|nr:hypothetical protein MtrunA17_Chr3g0087441 [Medicago truncatula]